MRPTRSDGTPKDPDFDDDAPRVRGARRRQASHMAQGAMVFMILKRVAYMRHATFGVLMQGDEPFAVTLEPTWQENKVNVSCIPVGEYWCAPVNSPKFGETFHILDVPGRSHILFHTGNLDEHTAGCILVGESFERLGGEPGIVRSRVGFEEFMRRAMRETSGAGEPRIRLTVV